MESISIMATESIRASVEATDHSTAVSPTVFAVEFSFTSIDVTPTGAWHTGSWESVAGPVRIATIRIGPEGDLALPIGRYRVWVRLRTTPDTPYEPTGLLEIY